MMTELASTLQQIHDHPTTPEDALTAILETGAYAVYEGPTSTDEKIIREAFAAVIQPYLQIENGVNIEACKLTDKGVKIYFCLPYFSCNDDYIKLDAAYKEPSSSPHQPHPILGTLQSMKIPLAGEGECIIC